MPAIKGLISFKAIPTAEITADTAQGCAASDQRIGIAMRGTVSAGVRVVPAVMELSTAASADSASTTRICGAPQFGQNMRPSSTSWPHL